ncbi:nucleotide-diphospho-sugar transferase [Aspergillus avenaceus]|uniref:Nucleotide-diphospho-sugar transferase n=1 Tax=Aspergillus avenaceus TaxID=36643 RepID=A0A5N6TR14_ASPAV|nr:nucleotide-diphospho-sugar transferase [Aspergillus avenaceus]
MRITTEYVGEIEELPPDSRILAGERYRRYLYHTARGAKWIFNSYFVVRLLLLLSTPQWSWTMWLMVMVEGLFFHLTYCDQRLTAATGQGPKCRPRKRLRLQGRENLPRVDVLVPCCGEPTQIILDTLRAACTMDYPTSCYRVLLLDDGASVELHDAVSQLRSTWPHLSYHSRGKQSGRTFAKAGNLNHALFTLQKESAPEFCAVLDADSIPRPEFLRATLPHLLLAPKSALVTTRQYFYNLPAGDPLSQSRLHFYTFQNTELDLRGNAIDSGSGAVFRRNAILDVGGYPTFSFSEDWQLSLILQGMGYGTMQVQEPLQFGLVPSSLEGHIAQRNRWNIGHSQQLHVLWPQTSRAIPQRLRRGIACGGVSIILGLVSLVAGFTAVPWLLSSEPVIPATSPFLVRLEVGLSLVTVTAMWTFVWMQNTAAGIRGPPFAHFENSWLAAAHLYAVLRFHLVSSSPKGSFVTGSNDNSWNHITKSSVYKVLYNDLWRNGILGCIFFLALTVGAMLSTTWGILTTADRGTLAARLLTTVAWPPLLHVWYLTITNFWVPVAYLLSPPHYPDRESRMVGTDRGISFPLVDADEQGHLTKTHFYRPFVLAAVTTVALSAMTLAM